MPKVFLETDNVVHTFHDNTVHEIACKTATRGTVDDLIVCLDYLYTNFPKDELMLQLIILQPAVGPVTYAAKQARSLIAKHPVIPPTRTAILYRENPAMSILRPSIRLLPAVNNSMAFYHAEQRNAALEWLLLKFRVPMLPVS